MALNSRQQAFVREYLIDLNATQAAIRAGYSPDTAKQIGSENLSKPDIAAAIEAGHSDRAARTGIQADTVLRELARLGLSDARRLFHGERMLSPEEWDDDTAACVASIETDTRIDRTLPDDDPGRVVTVTKIKLWDKNSALEKLCRHLGMFAKDNKLDVTVQTVAERLSRARQRAIERGEQ